MALTLRRKACTALTLEDNLNAVNFKEKSLTVVKFKESAQGRIQVFCFLRQILRSKMFERQFAKQIDVRIYRWGSGGRCKPPSGVWGEAPEIF